MSFPTVNGMLIDTDEETSKRPIAVRRGRRSGRARANILRNDVDVETAASASGEIEDGRNRERIERRVAGVGEGWEDVDVDDVGARMAGLVAKSRPPCAEACVGHGGYRLLFEGCGKVRRTESARRVPTQPKCRRSIMSDAVKPNAIDRTPMRETRERKEGNFS